MDYIKNGQGIKLIGQGEALVVDVRTGTDNNHQVRVRHPDFGETSFIPYIQTAGLFRVPAINDICYVFAKEGFKDYPLAWGSKLHDSAIKALLGARDNKITVLYSIAPDGKTVSHKIELDDGDNRGVRLSTAGGNKIELKNTDDITINHVDGAVAQFNKTQISLMIGGSTVNLKDQETHVLVGQSDVEVKPTETNIKVGLSTIKVTPTSITMQIGTSQLVMTASGVVMSAGANQMSVGAAGMEMNAGSSKVVLGDQVDIKSGDGQAKIDGIVISTHTHTSTAPGTPTGTPT